MVDRAIEDAATAAMMTAKKAAVGAGGQSKMLQYMLARLAMPKTPARSNKEGIGRVLGTFLLPMIAQGAQTWKENYDARGDWKANGDNIYKRWKAGEQLSPQEQRTLDIMRQNYPDRFNTTASGGQQPAPQGAQAPAPANNVDTSAIRQYIQQQLPQFENPAPGNALTGAALAQEAEDRLREVLGGEPKGWLLNALSYGR